MPPAPKRRRPVVEEPEAAPDAESEEEAPRNTQRRRRAPSSGDDDNEPEGAENPVGDDMEVDGAVTRNETDQLVKKLVRYALACEYSRFPIRRDGIRDKVFGKNKAAFKKVFEIAQDQLRHHFGMEMVELPLKEKITLKDRRAAAAQKSEAAKKASTTQKPQVSSTSNTWVLTSTLPAEYRIPTILPPSSIPTASSEGSYVGLYTMIISLISLAGGTLADAKLDRYLKRLNADVNMPMDKSELVLQKMIKQGYLIKIKDNVGGEEIVEWIVGPRGKVEVGVKGVQGLVTDAYGDSAPDDLAVRVKSSLGLDAPKKENEPLRSAVDGTQIREVRRPGRPRRPRDEDEED